MRVVGFPTMDFNTSSTSAWGNVRMRVAMVLDVTGSMANERQDGRDANGRQGPGRSAERARRRIPATSTSRWFRSPRTSISAPASTMQTWIDWSMWDSSPRSNTWGTCSNTNYTTRSNCMSNGKTWTPDRTKWNGCVTDRDQNYDTKNTTPSSSNAPTMVVAEEDIPSDGSTELLQDRAVQPYVQPIVPLSYDWSSLKTAIDSLDADRQYQPGHRTGMGLADAGRRRAVQCAGQGYGELYLQGGHRPAVGRSEHAKPLQHHRFGDRCAPEDPVRKRQGAPNNITIYTVQVDTGGDGESAVLKECASGTDKYYHDHRPQPDLDGVQSIGQSLAKLRVYR